MISWRERKQAAILSIIFGVFLFFTIVVSWFVLSKSTCSDGKKNGDETGVDCGGFCEQVCKDDILDPVVVWSKEFSGIGGLYNIAAKITNKNSGIVAKSAPYTFEIYNEYGKKIKTLEGVTYIPDASSFGVLQERVTLSEKPYKVFFAFKNNIRWEKVAKDKPLIIVTKKELYDIFKRPRLDIELENKSYFDIKNIDVFVALYDEFNRPIQVSKTILDALPYKERIKHRFTWPEKLPLKDGICEFPTHITLVVDRSGSMNDETVDENEEQPITSVREAVLNFVKNLSSNDLVSMVVYAKDAYSSFSEPKSKAEIDNDFYSQIKVRAEDEKGYTNTGDAIALAYKQFESTPQGYKKMLILLTDGRANWPLKPTGEEYALEIHSTLKTDDIDFITIALGNKTPISFLRELTKDPQKVVYADQKEELSSIYNSIAKSICKKEPYVIDVLPSVKEI